MQHLRPYAKRPNPIKDLENEIRLKDLALRRIQFLSSATPTLTLPQAVNILCDIWQLASREIKHEE